VADLALHRKTADARTRIVEAAERLFADRGYHAVSLRTIMAEAEVNVSAAHYYFRSQKNLFRAVFEERAMRINARRRERLTRCFKNGAPCSIENVLEAYVAPALEIATEPGGAMFVRIAAQASIDPNPEVRDIIETAYDETAQLFVAAIKKICPRVKSEDLFWRLNCVFGTMMYIRANNGRVAHILGSAHYDSLDVKSALKYVIPFLAAGFNKMPA
jgi:AcrR family transcriptional regulator